MPFLDNYGPWALVTGASSGIGQGFAEELASCGVNLLMTARRQDRLEKLGARLRAANAIEVECIVADLADPAAPHQLFEACAERDIGLVVSNAGFSVRGLHETLDAADLTEMLTVDCYAPLHLSRLFLPGLKARGRGGFLLVSSIESLIGCPFSAAYSAMKALVTHLGEALYAEASGSGVDILTCCPGATDTEAGIRAGIDMSKVANVQQPREVAAIALDNLANGPTCFPNAAYKDQFDKMLSMPRREALLAMTSAMKAQQ